MKLRATLVDRTVLDPTQETVPRGFRAPGTAFMIIGGLLGAFGAYLFQVIGGRVLGPAEFAPIGVLWTVLFIGITVVLVPLEQYVTREASRGRQVLEADRRVLVVVGLSSAVVGWLFAWSTRDSLFDGRGVYAVVLGAALVGYTVFVAAKGILAGHRRFKEVGWVLIGEAALRLGVAVAVLAVARSAPALAWSLAAAPLACLLLGFWRHDRPVREVAATSPAGFLGAYVLGSAASQILLAGAPLGVALLGGSPELISVTFVTFTLYRGPLTLIYALQGRILPFLVRMAENDGAGLRRLAVWVLGGGLVLVVVGAGVGWLVGPQVVSLLYGEAFTPTRTVAALAAGGVVAASTTQVAGQVLVARGRTGFLAGAWVVGLIAGLVTMFSSPGEPALVVGVAFLVGELAALLTLGALTVGRAGTAATRGTVAG